MKNTPLHIFAVILPRLFEKAYYIILISQQLKKMSMVINVRYIFFSKSAEAWYPVGRI
ncbi:hypothetical protein OBV_11720 [Oscillibacter valericigenes Sjm18-20]|nr:hypothetical protein OBV_11720 [Oscillibacter valericigenes Sjm18-20]